MLIFLYRGRHDFKDWNKVRILSGMKGLSDL